MKIKLENGTTLEVYVHSERKTVVDENDCKTEYEEIGETGIYKLC